MSVNTEGKKVSSWWLMLPAFLCYTGMYAVRKSFLAGQYGEMELFGVDLKVALVISQVIGYMLSKFIGIKLLSELAPKNRERMLYLFVSFGLLMLAAFAVLPVKYKPIAMFMNGLPLGMVFGIVLSYLEGRKNTELLAAALSATFIFSTGFVKTVGVWYIQQFAVGEFWMPFLTGLTFFPIFLLSVWFLGKSESPNEADVVLRSERKPMFGKERMQFLKLFKWEFAALVLVYILLTVLRDFRDNFIVEFWAELGYSGAPELITLTEAPIAVIVLIISALGVLVIPNKLAFRYGIALSFVGAVIVLVATSLFSAGSLAPEYWIIGTGVGVYLPYILFHCLVYERFLALFKFKGNIAFMFYVSDALGYLGSVAIMLLKEFGNFNVSWVSFFSSLNMYIGFALLVVIAMVYFLVAIRSKKEVQLATS